MTPAIRQRIPLVVRNSRKPKGEGTRINLAVPPCPNGVKAIGCKTDLKVLEIRPKDDRDPEEFAAALGDLCARYGMPAEFLCHNTGTIFLAMKNSTRYQDVPIELEGCVEVRLHPHAAILTLVGEAIDGSSKIALRALSALKHSPARILSSDRSKLALSLIVPSTEMQRSVGILHREFFQQIDPAFFAECQAPGSRSPQSVWSPTEPSDGAERTGTIRPFRPITVVGQN